jgi:hypothetical protein
MINLMPDDHHPLMPRGNPGDIDLSAIKADLEFLVEWVTRFRKEQALKPVYTMIGSAAIVIAWIEPFLAALPVKVNFAGGLRRIWIIGTILWIACSLYHYGTTCSVYPEAIHCWSLRGYYDYTFVQFFMTLIETEIGIPVLVFAFGTVVLWVGRWVAKGFQPSQHQGW